ncbi:MAG: hypothetical protein RI973_1333, partial [Bacteroidota bacterium]
FGYAKTKKMGIHSKYSWAAPAAKGLLRQAQKILSWGCVKSFLGAVPLFEKGAGHRPAERPFRKPCGTGGTSRKGCLHNPRKGFFGYTAGRSPAVYPSRKPSGTDGTNFKNALNLLTKVPCEIFCCDTFSGPISKPNSPYSYFLNPLPLTPAEGSQGKPQSILPASPRTIQ